MTITTGKGTAILKFIFLALACSLAIVAHAADDKKARGAEGGPENGPRYPATSL